MRITPLIVLLLVMAASPALAHCGKPHADGKDKTVLYRTLPKPE